MVPSLPLPKRVEKPVPKLVITEFESARVCFHCFVINFSNSEYIVYTFVGFLCASQERVCESLDTELQVVVSFPMWVPAN